MLDRVGGLLGRVGEIVRSCHERWDGKRLPGRPGRREIPFPSRIVFCCDAYNADDHHPRLPQGDAPRGRGRRAPRATPARSSTRWSWRPSSSVVEHRKPRSSTTDEVRALLAGTRANRDVSAERRRAASSSPGRPWRPARSTSRAGPPPTPPRRRRPPTPGGRDHRTGAHGVEQRRPDQEAEREGPRGERRPSRRTPARRACRARSPGSAGARRRAAARCRSRPPRRPPPRRGSTARARWPPRQGHQERAHQIATLQLGQRAAPRAAERAQDEARAVEGHQDREAGIAAAELVLREQQLAHVEQRAEEERRGRGNRGSGARRSSRPWPQPLARLAQERRSLLGAGIGLRRRAEAQRRQHQRRHGEAHSVDREDRLRARHQQEQGREPGPDDVAEVDDCAVERGGGRQSLAARDAGKRGERGGREERPFRGRPAAPAGAWARSRRPGRSPRRRAPGSRRR